MKLTPEQVRERCAEIADNVAIPWEREKKACGSAILGAACGMRAEIARDIAKFIRALDLGAPEPEGAPLQTRFQEFDDDSHPFQVWWKAHGQYMMSGGGRRESIWAARGWIAREQLAEGVEVTGESLQEEPSAPAAAPERCPTCGSENPFSYGRNCLKNADGWHRAHQGHNAAEQPGSEKAAPTEELRTETIGEELFSEVIHRINDQSAIDIINKRVAEYALGQKASRKEGK